MDIPFRLDCRPCLHDAGRDGSIQIGTLHPQLADTRHMEMVVPQCHIMRKGDSILITVAACESRITPLAFQKCPVGIRQVCQDVTHFGETVLLHPGVPGLLPLCYLGI